MMKLVRTTLLVIATFVVAAAAQSSPLEFNGALLSQEGSTQDAVTFRSKKDPDAVETIMIRSIEPGTGFDDVSRAFIARSKAESGGAELLVMDNAKRQEVMVAYLKELSPNRMLYKVERLSASTGLPAVSVAYSSEFRSRGNNDKNDASVKKTAIRAIASFDMDKARTLLKPER